MNQKNNQYPKSLNELVGEREPFNPLQRESLFPREMLQSLFEKWKKENTNGFTAESFFNFLLRQTK